MIFKLKKIKKILKNNIEISSLLLLMIITILSTTFYNNGKKQVNKNYRDIINNIFFQKTIDHIFDNLTPRYKTISHRVSGGETFDSILNSYSITIDEVIKIKKELNLDYNLDNLKTTFDIQFTIDE